MRSKPPSGDPGYPETIVAVVEAAALVELVADDEQAGERLDAREERARLLARRPCPDVGHG